MHPKNFYVANTTPTSPFSSKHHPSVAPSPTSSPHPSVSTSPVLITIQPMLGDPFEMPVMLDIDTVETLKESIATKLNLEEDGSAADGSAADDGDVEMGDVEEEQGNEKKRTPTSTTTSSTKTTKTTTKTHAYNSLYKLVCAGKVLEYGTLRENGLRAGSRVSIAPRLQSGKDTVAGMRLAQARAQKSVEKSVENIKAQVLEHIASILPEHLDKPITLSIPVGKNGLGGTVNVTIEPNNDDEASTTQQSPSAPATKEDVEITKLLQQLRTTTPPSSTSRKSSNTDDDDDDSTTSTTNAEARRALIQRLTNRAQDQAAIARVKAVENKRTSSKIEDLREKMKAKRAHLDRVTKGAKLPATSATTKTTTKTIPSVGGAGAGGALPAVSKTGFGGFKRGFLFASTSKKSL